MFNINQLCEYAAIKIKRVLCVYRFTLGLVRVLVYTYLAVIYVPIYSRLKSKGEQMLDEIPLSSQQDDQKEIIAIFRMQQTPIESIQIVLSISAPVLKSLVPGSLKI